MRTSHCEVRCAAQGCASMIHIQSDRINRNAFIEFLRTDACSSGYNLVKLGHLRNPVHPKLSAPKLLKFSRSMVHWKTAIKMLKRWKYWLLRANKLRWEGLPVRQRGKQLIKSKRSAFGSSGFDWQWHWNLSIEMRQSDSLAKCCGMLNGIRSNENGR